MTPDQGSLHNLSDLSPDQGSLHNLSDLDQEIWMDIVSYCGLMYIDAFKRTCKRFFEIGKEVQMNLQSIHPKCFRPRYSQDEPELRCEYALWLYRSGVPVDFETGICLARKGRLDVSTILYNYHALEVSHSKSLPFNSYYMSIEASMYGHVDFLEWLEHNSYELHKGILCEAATNGHLNVLQWILEKPHTYHYHWHHTTTLFVYVYDLAAKKGHLPILKWLKEKDPLGKWNHYKNRCLPRASANGHVHILQWFYELDPEFIESSLYIPAERKDQRHVLKYLKELGIPEPCAFERQWMSSHWFVLYRLYCQATSPLGG
jgi:hypothetical protein